MGPSRIENQQQLQDAEMIGAEVARRGHVLLTGGGSGIMEAASKGASEAGGLVAGISSRRDKSGMNQYVDIGIPTDMGSGRNYLNILASDVVVAIGNNNSAGTLSEIANALILRKPIAIYRPSAAMHRFFMEFEPSKNHVWSVDSVDVLGDFFGEAFETLARQQSERVTIPSFLQRSDRP
tara:strand:+ start:729 stop:1268 length:540 start_codon:yes stop_codon:yes gene_type:complete